MVRALILLALGWLILATSPPPRQTSAPVQSQSERAVANSLERIASTLQNKAEGAVANPPCGEGQDNRDSDLCAQWKAADAAAASASATWLFGLLGCLIGGATLIAASLAARYAKRAADHTETGAKAATNAVTETKRIGEAQVRCYLSIETAFVELDQYGTAKVTIVVKNSGQSPALDFQWASCVEFETARPKVKWRSLEATISFVEAIRDLPVGVSPPLMQLAAGSFLSEKKLIALNAARVAFFSVEILLTWKDVFGQEFAETHHMQEGRSSEFIAQPLTLHPARTAVVRKAESSRRES